MVRPGPAGAACMQRTLTGHPPTPCTRSPVPLTRCGRCFTELPHTSAYLNCLIRVLCSRLQKSWGKGGGGEAGAQGRL